LTPERALALGLAHGPLELLPVSSSAHVALLGAGEKEAQVAFHAGAALVLRPWPSVTFAALSTAPPSIAGLAFERVVEQRLGTPAAIAAGLVAGSAALLAASQRTGTRKAREATAADALALGAAQACALWPGVSRSGATLAAARWRGFSAQASWELSRASAAPVLVAACVLKGVRLAQRRPGRVELGSLAVAAAASAASTAVSLRAAPVWERVPLPVWSAYRTALAAAVVLNRKR
jgi:undecaprenyl-diphosphatase